MYKFYFHFDWLCPALLAVSLGLIFLASRYFAGTADAVDGAVFIAIHLAIVGGFARFFYEGATLTQQAKAGLTMLFLAMSLGALGNLMSNAHSLLPGFKFYFSWVELALMYAGAACATLSLYRLEKLPKDTAKPAQPAQSAADSSKQQASQTAQPEPALQKEQVLQAPEDSAPAQEMHAPNEPPKEVLNQEQSSEPAQESVEEQKPAPSTTLKTKKTNKAKQAQKTKQDPQTVPAAPPEPTK